MNEETIRSCDQLSSFHVLIKTGQSYLGPTILLLYYVTAMLQDNCPLLKASVCTNIYAPTITQNYFLPHNIPPERNQEHMWPCSSVIAS